MINQRVFEVAATYILDDTHAALTFCANYMSSDECKELVLIVGKVTLNTLVKRKMLLNFVFLTCYICNYYATAAAK